MHSHKSDFVNEAVRDGQVYKKDISSQAKSTDVSVLITSAKMYDYDNKPLNLLRPAVYHLQNGECKNSNLVFSPPFKVSKRVCYKNDRVSLLQYGGTRTFFALFHPHWLNGKVYSDLSLEGINSLYDISMKIKGNYYEFNNISP